ncbi:MAG: DeoR family transcriptional regulator [Microbacterium sp.]
MDLAQRFGVTTETVRRDLGQLETRGLVRRVHEAVAHSRVSTAERSLTERASRRSDANSPRAPRRRRPLRRLRGIRVPRRRHDDCGNCDAPGAASAGLLDQVVRAR